MSSYRDIISRRRNGAGPALARGGLLVLSAGYTAAVTARNWFHDHLARPVRLARPCISVGNLTAGGTGKTPLVAWLARTLGAAGVSVGILSRGYKGTAEGNDEHRLLRAACPGAVCIENPDRVAGGRLAIEQHDCDVLILDDGMQHRRVARDLEIVLIDALCPDGFGHVLPRGLLREPFSGLQRADIVILTHISQVRAEQVDALRRRCAELTGAVLLGCEHRPDHLVDLNGTVRDLSTLEGATLLGFAGIGNPDGFEGTLGRVGARPLGLIRFPDHHHYTVEDCRKICDTAQQLGAEAVITTEKDLVKLAALGFSWPQPLWALSILIDFVGKGGRILADRCMRLLEKDVCPDDSRL